MNYIENLSDEQKKFMHYMLCGHGRCFSLIAKNKENFRDIVLYGCLNDISYDMQCEGTRGRFVYDLVLEYDDCDYFLGYTLQKFLSPDVNDDVNLFSHLLDLTECFAYDMKNENAVNALKEKYKQLYDMIMTSCQSSDILQSYEYMAIVMMQNGDDKCASDIFSDIGAYFIRCKDIDDNELRLHFSWFMQCAEEKFGENLKDKMLFENSKETEYFIRVMSCENRTYGNIKKEISSDEFIKKAENGCISRKDVLCFRISDKGNAEHIKLAENLINHKNDDARAEMLKAFTVSGCAFPLDSGILTGYAHSENEALRNTAIDALLYVKSEKAHDLALDILSEKSSLNALLILINNFTENDSELLMSYLDKLYIDRENTSGWHNIVLALLSNAENMPDEAIMFIYENSMCSCCRRDAADEMIRRGLINDVTAEECRMDCNEEIREKFAYM